jgi:hypothetical protein
MLRYGKIYYKTFSTFLPEFIEFIKEFDSTHFVLISKECSQNYKHININSLLKRTIKIRITKFYDIHYKCAIVFIIIIISYKL